VSKAGIEYNFKRLRGARLKDIPITCNQIIYDLNQIQRSIHRTPEHVSIHEITRVIRQIEELYDNSITYPLHDAIMLLEQCDRYDSRISIFLDTMTGLLVKKLESRIK
jgi:hypothetical protein